MPEIGLQGSSIDTIVGELVPAGVPKHVRMDFDRKGRRLTGTFHHGLEAADREGGSAFGDKHVI